MKDDKRLKRKVRNSYIVSTVSIMLVLFLLGSVGYLMVAAMKVAQTLQESIAVTVELQNGISDQQRETINKRLTAEELVATVAYVSKEDKADDAEFRKMFESEFEEILGENPLLDSFELTLTAESADKELLDGFIASVSGIAGVERVSYPALMAERLHATVGKIRLVLLLFGGALLIISLILLSNTTGGLAAVRAFGLRTQRSGPRTDDHRRERQNRHYPRRDDCGRRRHIGTLHRRGPQQIRQHEVEQDIPLLNEKSE